MHRTTLVRNLGAPAVKFSGVEFLRLRAPLVYLWLRDDRVLYIGTGANGLSRPFFVSHHRLCEMQPTDDLYIWTCKTREDALRLERHLIETVKPELNSAGARRSPRPRGAVQGLYRENDRWYLEFCFRNVRYRKSLGKVSLTEARTLAAEYRVAVMKKVSRNRVAIGKGYALKKKRLPKLGRVNGPAVDVSTVIESSAQSDFSTGL